MVQLKKVSGENQILFLGTPTTLTLRAEGAGEGELQVEFSSRDDDVLIEPRVLSLAGDAPGSVTLTVLRGDRRHLIDAVLQQADSASEAEAVASEAPAVASEGESEAEADASEAPAADGEAAPAATATAGPQRARVTFAVRAVDPGDVTLASAQSLLNDLGILGHFGDKAFHRRLNEELRAITQAVKNIEEKLRVRADAVPEEGTRQLLAERLNRLLGTVRS